MSDDPGAESSRRGIALLERRETFDPEPTSAGRARRILRDALEEARRDGWVDAAELALSELVTNATLHAHSTIELHVEVYDEEVCVEVRDLNPSLPVQRDHDREATTGRGMNLVAAVSQACGVRSLGPDGKVVWFCVGDAAAVGPTPEELLDAWDVNDIPPVASAADTREVVLQSMPATLWLSASQHHDTMLRELALHRAQHPGTNGDLAGADVARTLIAHALAAAIDEARHDGAARPAVPDGHPSPLPWVPTDLDLRLTVPVDGGDAFAALQDVLDTAERLAVDGALLARPGLPEVIAVRDWACEQVIAQLASAPPAAWPGTAQERFETDVHDRGRSAHAGWDSSLVRDATRAVIAADEANRIIGVSPALADLLGWAVDDLVGRRVVTVIPPALREAHVAGFTRHLTTGEAHVLGVPLELPVLARDGREIRCRFLIEHRPAEAGRSIYLAWLDPVDTTDAEAGVWR